MFNSDKPIECASEDLLKRATFSKQLAKAIISYTAEDNFTVGLCGEWGCGKTSILNMVIQEINILTVTLEDHEKPIIVQFNPWNYSNRDQLLTQFFQTILVKLGKSDGNEKLKAVGTALKKYSAALEYTTYIPIVGKYLSPLTSILSGAGEHVKEISEAKEDVAVQKEVVIRTLREQKQKIIVVIDDIDRLNNDQIRLIFQLVNSLAGFPNMIYLLSFDKTVVVRALENEQNCNGEEYLEKIIQVPFDVPVAKKAAVHQVFFDKLNKLFNEIPYSDFDEEYWNIVFNHCIAHFLNSIRDVNRIINVYRFKFGLMHDETNCIDLLAITTLQISAPQIATWIFQNSTILTGSVQSAGGTTSIEQKRRYEQYFKQFSSIYPSNPTVMINTIQILFPKFGWLTGGYNVSYDSDEELRRKQRMAHSERFDFYFNLSLEDIVITREEILSTITDMDAATLSDYLNRLMQNSHLVEYLSELRSYINDIPLDRLPLFFTELLRLQSIPENHDRKYYLAPVPAYECTFCIFEILKRMDEQSRYNVLSSSICHANFDTFPFVTQILLEIERAWGKIGNSTDDNYRIVSEKQLVELEKLWLETINKMSGGDNLLDSNYFTSISILWGALGPKAYREYISKQLLVPANVPKYLNVIAGSWVGRHSKGWTFKEDDFSDFITKDAAYAKICELKGTSEFSKLAPLFKQICIAYFIWYQLGEKKNADILKENVNALIPLWESEQYSTDETTIRASHNV